MEDEQAMSRWRLLITILFILPISSTCFANSFHRVPYVYGRIYDTIRYDLSRPGSIELYLARNNKTDLEKSDEISNDFFHLEQPSLLACDICGIVIASQLMGLLDVLNDPSFSSNGGWAQPVPAVPSTLGELIQRFSILSFSWIAVALARGNAFDSKVNETPEVAVKTTLRIWVDFCMLQILLGVAIPYTTGVDIDFGEILRRCYFTGLAIPTFRFLFVQYIRQ